MTLMHGVLELMALLLGAALHILMGWLMWRQTDTGHAAGGKFKAYRAQPGKWARMLAALVIFVAVIGRGTFLAMIGIKLAAAGHLVVSPLFAELAALTVVGYVVHSQAQNLLTLLERAVMNRIKGWIKKLGSNGAPPAAGGGKLPG